MRAIVNDLAEQLPEGGSFLPMLFLQNNWLRGQQFDAFMRNEAVYTAFNSFLESLPSTLTADSLSDYAIERDELAADSRAILDLNIYNDRLYVGLDKGCFQRDFFWESRRVAPKGPLQRRFDARCMGISTGYGALNLSCGDAGLFTSADVFDWDRQINPRHEMSQVASSSLRSAWMHEDLMNYSNPAAPELLRGDLSGVSKRKLVQVRDERISLDELLRKVREEHGVRDRDVQFSFNSDKLMFLHTHDGRFFGIEVKWRKGDSPIPKLTKTYKGEGTRILSAAFCRVGTAIETENRVFLFSNGLWHGLLDDEVISLRTFPDQPPLQNIVMAVIESGILLTSLFDDEPHGRRFHRHRV
jgi:hypothetical protein